MSLVLTTTGCFRCRFLGEAMSRFALPDGLVEALAEGDVRLALGALDELAAATGK